ncbi:hypothetical protein CfE428DRAFT_5797 [Chthoniobacter flavus Ellin428]|uniref:Uncharacterized protein n=1 Tax=Chthoniobacter flavus Ellin428 TaxID=497964 RepID=B4DA57_9BACT|nr:hypothetical protein [Chthoniobacter flavus]EDY16684.1 hypothetical protein CfE428DRAFT_5797 [Chthoniobacter flavus Ellin428]TCO87257.1 hypothetical protein EV701_12394 [Chthoniobacter flavus]
MTITINYSVATGTAKLSTTTIVKQGKQIPVQVIFDQAPGTVNSIQVALGTDATPPAILAYVDTFTQENDTTWAAILDGTDSRLATFMTGKGATQLNLELDLTLDGVDMAAPNMQVTVQPPIVAQSETSLSTPTYYTKAQVDSAIAAAILGLAPAANQSDLTPSAATTAALFAATEFSTIDRNIIAGAGSGAYTAAYTLPTASMVTGAIAEVNIQLPASANPTIEIHDGAGTLLATVTNPAPAAVAYWYGRFRFDGTAWHPRFRAFQL